MSILSSHFRLVFSAFLVFVIASCESESDVAEEKNNAAGLMAKLEAANTLRDTVLYTSLKKTVEAEIEKGDIQLKFYYQTHQANQLAVEGDFDKAEKLLKETIKEAEGAKEFFSVASCYGTLGRIAFFKSEKDQAIDYWKKSVAVAEKHHIDEHIPPMLGNLGVVYLNMGYASTASYYFLKSQSYMEKMGKKNENYYVNQINIINAYCSLNQYSKAMKMMRTIDQHYSDKIRYLYFSILASIHMELNDRDKTAMYLDSSRFWLRNNKEYALNQLELELESAWHFNFKDRLEKGIADYLSDKSQKSLTLKCTFNRAYKRINGKFYDGLKEVENWKKELIPTDYINGDIYYGFIADFYAEQKNQKNQISSLLKQREVHDLLVKEKLSNQLEDYTLSYRNEQIQHQNRVLALKNESKESQIKRQRILLTVLIILIILALSFSIFLITLYGKQQRIKRREQELNELEASLMNKQLDEYKSSLKVLQRLFYKTSLLKKQLDDSFKTLSSIDNPDEMQTAIMRIKTDVKVFYQAHQNLLSENMAGELVKSKVDQLSKIFPELNDKELKIIELILEEFSTNEIAVMLEKSTKNIEFTRTNIRKKMNLSAQLDLNTFLRDWHA